MQTVDLNGEAQAGVYRRPDGSWGTMIKSIYPIERLRAACESVVPADGHLGIMACLREVSPDLIFTLAHERSGWHRPGGVVDEAGNRVADDVRAWTAAELGTISPEMDVPEEFLDYRATRIDGTTLYFVASSGPRAWDFVQLELELLQEVVDRELFSEDFIPGDVEEFLDPPGVTRTNIPVGVPRYRFHGVHHIAQLIEELDKSLGTNRRFTRFLVDWENSRAAAATPLSAHWVLRIFKYVDRFGEQKIEAQPIPTTSLRPSLPEGQETLAGLDLDKWLTSYDKAVGYPMAWFFDMLTHRKSMHVVAEQVHRDHENDAFAYLGEQDLSVVRAWYREPYCF